MLGTVEAVEPERLNIRLDEQRAASRGPFQEGNQDRRTIELNAARYTALDHGYAMTIHESQGATVDRAFVLVSPGMDSHLTYVATIRHREAVRSLEPDSKVYDRKLHVGARHLADTKDAFEKGIVVWNHLGAVSFFPRCLLSYAALRENGRLAK